MPVPFLPYRSESIHAPFISINYEHSRDLDHAESALQTIKSKPVGKNLLLSLLYLSNEDRRVIIVVKGQLTDGTSSFPSQSQLRRFNVANNPGDRLYQTLSNMMSTVNPNGQPSEGCSAVVQFNPYNSIHIDNEGYPVPVSTTQHNFVSLAHELIHALHTMNGTALNRDSIASDVFYRGSGTRREEERAVGLGRFEREAISENKIRQEHGLRIRRSYFTKDRPPIT